jgi:hypothetical protein
MARLNNFFGSLEYNHTYTVLLRIGTSIGTCTYPDFNDFHVHCKGHAQFAFFGGDFDVTITLTDRNPNASSGPCTVVANGSTDTNAAYKVNGSTIEISTELLGGGSFTFSREGTTTHIGVPGVKPDLWIEK